MTPATWTMTTTHTLGECPECVEALTSAIDHATATGSRQATVMLEHVTYTDGNQPRAVAVTHRADVERAA